MNVLHKTFCPSRHARWKINALAATVALLLSSGSALAQSQKPGGGGGGGGGGTTVDCGTVTCSPSSVQGLGAIVNPSGVTFRVWAPNASAVSAVGTFNNWDQAANPLCPECVGGTFNGYWSADVGTAVAGDQYEYYITNGSQTLLKRDPRSRWVTHSGTSDGRSIIYDTNAYDWTGDANVNVIAEDMVIYEMHPGTFHAPNGAPATFWDAIPQLDHVVSLGATAVEVMPLAEFPAEFSWGYNPADLFSVENIAYGGPDAFKDFVKAAHARGLAVIVDVVHNHYGPTDLDIWQFDGWSGKSDGSGGGIYFFEDGREVTPWGDTRPNYDKTEVRQFILDQISTYMDEYRVDGFRWDATCYIRTVSCGGDDIASGISLLQEANDLIHSKGGFSHGEDLQGWTALTAPTSGGGFGFDSQWDGSFWTVRGAATASNDSDRNMGAIANELKSTIENGSSTSQIWYTESHDEVGCLNSKKRLPEAISTNNCTSLDAKRRSTQAAAIAFTAPAIPMLFMGQEFYECGCWSDSQGLNWTNATTYAGLLQYYTDLIMLRRDLGGTTLGLMGANINTHHVNDTTKVLAYHRWKNGGATDDVIVVANYSGSTLSNYTIGLPHGGTWSLRLNSDSTLYDPSFTNVGGDIVAASTCADGFTFSGNINIAPYSVHVYSQNSGALDDTNPGDCSGGGGLFASSYTSVNVPGSDATIFGAAWDPCNSAAAMTLVADYTWTWERAVSFGGGPNSTKSVQYKFAMNCSWDINRGLGSTSGSSVPQQNTNLTQGGADISANLPKGTLVWEYHEDTESSKLFVK